MKFLSLIICLFVLNASLSEAKVSKFFKIGAQKFKKTHLHKSKK